MSKEFEEEVFAPNGELHFAGDGSFVGVCLQDIESHAPDEGQVLRSMIFAGSCIIFMEDDIESSMKMVFDAPMCADRFHHDFGRHWFGQDGIVDEDRDFAVAGAPFALDPPEHGEPGKARGAVGRLDDAGPAALETVMAAGADLMESQLPALSAWAKARTAQSYRGP